MEHVVEQCAVSELKPHPNNSRKHSPDQIQKLAAAIKRFGFTQPILVDGSGQILAGHGRLEGAKLLKMKTVPVIRLDHLTNEEARAYIIADNRLSELSVWDTKVLEEELTVLADYFAEDDPALRQLLDYSSYVGYTLEQIRVDDLLPHPRNYRTHTPEQLEHLQKSITEHGIYRNIIVSSDGYILAGHGVCLAAQKLGIITVPCLRIGIPHDSVKAIKLLTADNEVEGLADSDARILTGLLSDIFKEDDLLGTGYDKARLEGLLIASRSKTELANSPDDEFGDFVDGFEESKYLKVIVTFEDEEGRQDFAKHLGIALSDKQKSLWWPPKERSERNVEYKEVVVE